MRPAARRRACRAVIVIVAASLGMLLLCLPGGSSSGSGDSSSSTGPNDNGFGGSAGEAVSTEVLETHHPHKPIRLTRGDPAAPSVFLAIGSAPKKHALRDALRATWLSRCRAPSCAYRFFTDANVTLADRLAGQSPAADSSAGTAAGIPWDVVTTPADEGGYSNFGIRAVHQMEWSLRYVDFDHYLRLDDDGLLCVEHLLHDLRQLPLKRLFWGKYWCQHMARMDENFMLMSRDVAFTLAQGWRSGLLPFRAQMSLDKLTANLQPMMNLDVVGDATRMRWLGPVLQLPQQHHSSNHDYAETGLRRQLRKYRPNKTSTNDGGNVCLPHYEKQDRFNITAQELQWQKAQQLEETWARCPDICHRFVWLHHLNPAEVKRLYANAAAFDPTSKALAALPSAEERALRPTQCRGWKGFPLFDTQKTTGKKVQRREVIQNQSCFWTWCTEAFGGACCNPWHRRAMRGRIETIFAAFEAFEANHSHSASSSV